MAPADLVAILPFRPLAWQTLIVDARVKVTNGRGESLLNTRTVR
ncbi:hypothetical protein BSU04_33550 [Caballeronia sordidicola]|uniref:Uncharacterized protein n=1 Tax=Caballeronia sordidicola TaxID=196367 RepID=A0A226WSF0_CABSO|nr:hypothetical protein BSU04_33550 [Caballeronia sordidicola]